MDQETVELHNEAQRAYYRAAVRPTIAPGATAYVVRHIDEVLAFGRITPGERVLDAGCGMGRHAFLLADRGIRVEGLELSRDLLDRMREHDRGRYGICTHCADIASPPSELTGSFDAVVGFFVLHHLSDLNAAFRGVERVLRPGGRVVFIEPNPYNPLYYAQIAFTPGMKWSAEQGITRLRRTPMFSAMLQAGLSSPAVRRFGFLPPILRNQRWGGPAEAALEKVGFLRGLQAFQLFRAEKVETRR